MHLFLWAEDSEAELRSELAHLFPGNPIGSPHPRLLETDFDLSLGRPLPCLAFARQWLPDSQPLRAASIRAWAAELFQAVVGTLPDGQPWSLHLEPCYGTRTVHRMGARAWHSAARARTAQVGAPAKLEASREARTPGADAEAGRHRCRLIREALVELLRQKRRHLLRHLHSEPLPFTANDSLVQALLTSPETGFISVARAPMLFEQRHLLSPFPGGEVRVASDQSAPSRAFAKLVEAELRLGRAIRAGETCVDLGASPGSWTYVAVNRGARVVALDRSPLRDDLMRNRQVEFRPADAFDYAPPRPVDWLLCDVIAAPERTAELLQRWLRRGWCRQFVVTLKLKDAPGTDTLAHLKRELPPLTRELFLTRLCANKKEACAFGVATAPLSRPA